jgi:hypothetical protein
MKTLKAISLVILFIVVSNFAYAEKYDATTESSGVICEIDEKTICEKVIKTPVETSFTREQMIIFSVPLFFNINSNYNNFQKIK